jgi:hypothetical protein
VEQPIQTAVALTAESVTHFAGAGGFQRRDTSQGGELGLAEAWPWRPELGDEGGSCQWTQARNGLERGETLRDSVLELLVKMVLLVCQQRQLSSYLLNCLFALAGKLGLARRGVGLASADTGPGGQVGNVLFVRWVAQK